MPRLVTGVLVLWLAAEPTWARFQEPGATSDRLQSAEDNQAVEKESGAEDREVSEDHQQVDETQGEEASLEARHQLEFGVNVLGIRGEKSVNTFAFGYHWVPHENHGLHLTFNYLESEFEEDTGDGLSDTLLVYSWVPSHKISALPLLPKRLGTGLAVTLPTGDLTGETGLDMSVAAPFLGWTWLLTESFMVAPNITYYHSFNHGDLAIPLRGLGFDLAMVYAPGSKWWVTFIPSSFRNSEGDEWSWNYSLQVGREFGTRWSLSAEWGEEEGGVGDLDLNLQSAFDQRLALRVHFMIHK